MDILDCIPYGKENAVTREELVRRTGLDDRVIRKAISHARRNDPILNLQNGAGYYRPTMQDIVELKRFVAQEEHRSSEIVSGVLSAKRMLRRLSE